MKREVFREIQSMGKRSYSRFNGFQENIADGRPNEWRCRAGARYMYICEDGLVHYCSQQRGWPAIPVEQYTREHIRREFLTEKSCAPSCTISCVHQVSLIDHWRAPQMLSAPEAPAGGPRADRVVFTISFRSLLSRGKYACGTVRPCGRPGGRIRQLSGIWRIPSPDLRHLMTNFCNTMRSERDYL